MFSPYALKIQMFEHLFFKVSTVNTLCFVQDPLFSSLNAKFLPWIVQDSSFPFENAQSSPWIVQDLSFPSENAQSSPWIILKIFRIMAQESPIEIIPPQNSLFCKYNNAAVPSKCFKLPPFTLLFYSSSTL